MARFAFKPGTNKLKATAKRDLFIVSSASSPGTDGDFIINFRSNDRIDLPGDWTKRNGKPRQIKHLYANYIYSDKGFRIDNLDESAFVKKKGQTGYLGLADLEVNVSGYKRTEGLVIQYIIDTVNANNNPLVFLIDYKGPVAVI
jgi:hypothetical protein